jgi:uncharacterized protein YjbJ (UPF0337 family)
MNRDEIEGKVEGLKGKAKQAVGRMTDDPVLEDEGLQDETAGKTQEVIGTARRKVGDAVEKLGEKINY